MARETVKIPIFEKTYRSVDQVELSDKNYLLMDAYLDEAGGTVARPGSKALWEIVTSTGLGCEGIFFWADKNVAIVVGAGRVYRLTYDGSVPTAVDLGEFPSTGRRVSFTTDGRWVFFANGGRIYTTAENEGLTVLGDADAPRNVVGVEYIDGYILAIDKSNKFYWADVNNSLSWSALNFASAAGNSDDIVSIKVVNREIYLIGRRSIEVWENDGETPFSRIPGGFIQAGCSAPDSVAQHDGFLYWLDDRRNFLRFNGKSVERLASPYDRVIQSFNNVECATIDKYDIDSRPMFVFNFPQDNRTLVYNIAQEDWSEWGRWDSERGEYDQYIGACYTYAEPWGLHLIGRRDKIVVSEISQSYCDDDGASIRVMRVSGHVNHGTLKTKACHEVRMVVRRGNGLSTRTPKIMIRYKDDNRNWTQLKNFSLGNKGEYEIVLRDKRRSIYRTRQYEFSATDCVPIVFVNAEADIEVLR